MAAIIGILKVILTVVLVLLIAALILLVLILFVPVRYKISGSFRKEVPDARAEAKWLVGLLSVKAAYAKEGGAEAYVNVFGHKVYDILGNDDTESDESSSDSSKERNDLKDGNDEINKSHDVSAESADTVCSLPAQGTDAADEDCSSEAEAKQGISETAKEDVSGGRIRESYVGEENKSGGAASGRRPRVSVYSAKKPVRTYLSELKDDGVSVKSVLLKPVKAVRKGLNKAADKISRAADTAEAKLRSAFNKAAETFASAKETFTKRSTQAKALKALWDDKRYAPGKALLLDRIVKILLELKPRTGSGYVRIGRDDPYGTGQIAQAAAFLYPFYADTIEVIPDFDQSIIEGELDVGGRVRLIIPAEAALRVFFSRELKAMYKKARQILELD